MIGTPRLANAAASVTTIRPAVSLGELAGFAARWYRSPGLSAAPLASRREWVVAVGAAFPDLAILVMHHQLALVPLGELSSLLDAGGWWRAFRRPACFRSPRRANLVGADIVDITLLRHFGSSCRRCFAPPHHPPPLCPRGALKPDHSRAWSGGAESLDPRPLHGEIALGNDARLHETRAWALLSPTAGTQTRPGNGCTRDDAAPAADPPLIVLVADPCSAVAVVAPTALHTR
jgi:hypothetical protein